MIALLNHMTALSNSLSLYEHMYVFPHVFAYVRIARYMNSQIPVQCTNVHTVLVKYLYDNVKLLGMQ